MEAAVIFNRNRGDRAKIEAALEAAGVPASIKAAEGNEIEQCVRDAVEAGARLVIVGGGDGSMSAAAQVLAGSEATLAILPIGTLNHLARDLGLPFELEKAAEVIAKGRTRAIDVAEINGRVFINNAAIGLYPLMVLDREAQQERLGRSKRLAMLVASLRTMVRFHHQRLTLTSNDGEERVDTPLLFVGNNDYQLEMPGAGKRERLDDGKLCVLVLRKKGLPGFLSAVGRALLGMTRNHDMVRIDDIEKLRVGSPRSTITLALDGETTSMKPPLDFRIRRHALKVMVPA